MTIKDKTIEFNSDEEKDMSSSPSYFEVLTYPADFTLENLIMKYNKSQIKIPGFQRKYVWDIKQASKLIESFLLGLPVPAIFLYNDLEDNNVLNVIDGQQRLLSIIYYFKGSFKEPIKGKQVIFQLTGLNEKSPYHELTINGLKTKDPAAFNRLNDSVLRAFVVKQINPKDNTSIYHIFERLNTGGSQLVGQEIRNCVYHGKFNELLIDLNNYDNWRKIFGIPKVHERLRDVELILRFLSLKNNYKNYQKPMKDWLSNYMKEKQNPKKDEIDRISEEFKSICQNIIKYLGIKPFHIKSGINSAIFDSVFIAFSNNKKVPKDIKKRYDKLIKDQNYMKFTTSATTDEENVKNRIIIAEKVLFS